MTRDWILLAARIAAPLLLYAFLGWVFYQLWAAKKKESRPAAHLRQVDNPAAAWPLKTQTFVGRDEINTIVIDDEFISARHASLTYRDGRWWLADLDSTNGTWLNDAPVTGPVPLNNGDTIGLGHLQYRLEAEA